MDKYNDTVHFGKDVGSSSTTMYSSTNEPYTIKLNQGESVREDMFVTGCAILAQCLICGEDVQINSLNHNSVVICDKCKDAVMHVRNQIENTVHLKHTEGRINYDREV